jgi:hypothetical protein
MVKSGTVTDALELPQDFNKSDYRILLPETREGEQEYLVLFKLNSKHEPETGLLTREHCFVLKGDHCKSYAQLMLEIGFKGCLDYFVAQPLSERLHVSSDPTPLLYRHKQ